LSIPSECKPEGILKDAEIDNVLVPLLEILNKYRN
jgi:hypothetical protein